MMMMILADLNHRRYYSIQKPLLNMFSNTYLLSSEKKSLRYCRHWLRDLDRVQDLNHSIIKDGPSVYASLISIISIQLTRKRLGK